MSRAFLIVSLQVAERPGIFGQRLGRACPRRVRVSPSALASKNRTRLRSWLTCTHRRCLCATHRAIDPQSTTFLFAFSLIARKCRRTQPTRHRARQRRDVRLGSAALSSRSPSKSLATATSIYTFNSKEISHEVGRRVASHSQEVIGRHRRAEAMFRFSARIRRRSRRAPTKVQYRFGSTQRGSLVSCLYQKNGSLLIKTHELMACMFAEVYLGVSRLLCLPLNRVIIFFFGDGINTRLFFSCCLRM